MIAVDKIIDKKALQSAFEIRKEVFVQEQEVPENEEYDQYEDTSVHFLATYKGQPAGTCRWRVTENGIKLERFAVLKQYRGKGVGEALVEACLSDLKPVRNNRKVYLHAQEHAVPFYEKVGFFTFGERFYECDIPHFKMML